MEDILASIRRIISDEEKDGTGGSPARERVAQPEQHRLEPAYETRPSQAASGDSAPFSVSGSRQSPMPHMPMANVSAQTAAAPLQSLADEDVLDLTDELIFADEAAEASSQRHSSPPPSSANHDDGGDKATPQPSHTRSLSQPDVPQPRPSSGSMEALHGARSQWSRRELPQSQGAMQSFSVGGGSFSRNAAAAENTGTNNPAKSSQSGEVQKDAPKSWTEDVQMPVPDQGPVPLMGAASEPRTWSQRTFQAPASRSSVDKGAQQSGKSSKPTRADNHANYGVPQFPEPPPQSLQTASAAKDDTTEAVAAFAQTLARNAVDALDDKELKEARNIDFEHLDERRKTNVSETFANVIEAARNHDPAADNKHMPQNSILDDLPHEFSEAPKAGEGEQDIGWPPMPPPDAPEPAPAFEPQRFSLPMKEKAEVKKPQFSRAGEKTTVSGKRPSTPEASSQAQAARQDFAPILQAGFTGSSALSPLSGATGRTLEDSVREMLRPMLLQWLNDNMPRIIENAIREEIAVRGLVTPSDPPKK